MKKGEHCHKCQQLTPFKELATWKDKERGIINYYSPFICLKLSKDKINNVKITYYEYRGNKKK